MLSKNRLIKELKSKTYWYTKEDTTDKDIQKMIENWLRHNPEGIETYIKNSEVVFKRCKGSSEGRKIDLANKKNETDSVWRSEGGESGDL